MKTIKIGSVEMPLDDFVVSRNAILGITKSGKTFTAKGVVEQLLEHNVPVIIFDAIGMWRFLKVPSGKSGGKGFPIVVAGGAQPDLPLTPQTAPQIVRAAIQQNISLVIDLYDPKLSKSDWRKIVQDCFRILLFENKGFRHIILEEAAEYVPQKVMDGETYAEVEKLARMGGNASLGITFINPRAQELNKSVLELCDNIILLRQRGTNAIDSLERQMDKLSPSKAKEIALTMPNMTQGDCWVFTENGDEPVRTRSHQIKSFHPDRRNPEANKVIGKAVDTGEFVSSLSGSLEKVIAEAKSNDPIELKKKVRELEAELSKSEQYAVPSKIVEVPALTDAERKRLTKLIEVGENFVSALGTVYSEIQTLSGFKAGMLDELAFFKNLLAGKLLTTATIRPVLKMALPAARQERAAFSNHQNPKSFSTSDSSEISPVGQRILNALAEMQLLGANSPDREIVALLAGYTNLASKGFVNAVCSLRVAGMVNYPDSETIALTEAGASSAQFPSRPTSSEEVQSRVCNLIGGAASKILRPLIDAYPDSVPRIEIAAAAGYGNLASKGFVNAASRLRTLGFVDYPDSKSIVATEILFLK